MAVRLHAQSLVLRMLEDRAGGFGTHSSPLTYMATPGLPAFFMGVFAIHRAILGLRCAANRTLVASILVFGAAMSTAFATQGAGDPRRAYGWAFWLLLLLSASLGTKAAGARPRG